MHIYCSAILINLGTYAKIIIFRILDFRTIHFKETHWSEKVSHETDVLVSKDWSHRIDCKEQNKVRATGFIN